MLNEQYILRGVNEKNEKAWKYLFDAYYAALCAYVHKILKNREHVEDLVQTVFIKLWELPKTFTDVQELTCYLYKACYNNTLLFIRNNRIHDTILKDLAAGKENDPLTVDEIYALTVREEIIRQLYLYIEKLPTEQKKVILLKIEGHSWEEIATLLGVSINTVKTHKSRGYKFLKSKLQKPGLSALLIAFYLLEM